MRLIRPIFLLVCILLTGLLIWAGVYTRKQGFTHSWRDIIEKEFASRGYFVDIGKLTLGAFRGLVAEDVRFYQDAERREEIAFVDDVYLDLDLSRILEKKLSVNTLDVQDAKLLLPLDPAKPRGPKLYVQNVSGRIVVTEGFIEIMKAQAEVSGVALTLKGTLIRPPQFLEEKEEKGEQTEEEMAAVTGRYAILRQVVGLLNSMQFSEEDKPLVEVEFRGDLRDLTTIDATAKIEALNFGKKNQDYRIDQLTADIEFNGRQNVALLKNFALNDGMGNLQIEAKWEQAKDRINFKGESSADLTSLVGMFNRDNRIREIVFFQAPEFSAEGYINLDEIGKSEAFHFPGQVLGDVHTEKFVSRGTVFNSLDFGYSLEGPRMYFRNVRLDHKTGVGFLNFKYEPGEADEAVKYQCEIKFDPRVFRPFFNEGGRKFLDSWDLNDQSTVYIAAVGQGPDLSIQKWANKGVIDLRNFRLNGTEFIQLETEVETDQKFLWFRNVKMVREEGQISAELAQVNLDEDLWELKGVVSNTDLVEGARAFSPKLARSLTRYQLSEPATIRLHGQVDGRRVEEVGDTPRNNKLSLSFESEGTAYFDFLGKTLNLVKPRGEIEIDSSRVHVTSFHAGTFGGEVEVEFDSKNVRSPSKPYDTTIRVSNMALESITRLYGDYDASKGRVSAVFNLSGSATGSVASLNGHGTAKIVDGDLFAIPLLGALSRTLKKNDETAGRIGNNIAREATATCSIVNGVISSDDLEALTDNFVVRAAGSVDCSRETVDVEAVVNFRNGAASVIAAPLSELFTYSCTGSVHDPQWKPKHISNMGKLPTQVLTEITGIPLKGLQALGKTFLGNGHTRTEAGGEEKPAEGSPTEARPQGNGTGKAIEGLGRQIFGGKKSSE